MFCLSILCLLMLNVSSFWCTIWESFDFTIFQSTPSNTSFVPCWQKLSSTRFINLTLNRNILNLTCKSAMFHSSKSKYLIHKNNLVIESLKWPFSIGLMSGFKIILYIYTVYGKENLDRLGSIAQMGYNGPFGI